MIVKVCGITSREDALDAIAAGANALGFNFWPSSPRYISADRAAEFVPALPAGLLRVGVFVNATAAEIAEAAQRAALDIVQLHGASEAPAGLRRWRAAAVKPGFDPAIALSDTGAEAFLLDAPSGDRHGGTGQTYDWNLIRGLRQRIVLAGGLDGANVARAIETAQPWGVDACSRLEAAPGRKDPARVAAFVQAALDAAAIAHSSS
ncbi:MAG: phosphoribosylanthranilate isomerase [Acidobacteria bacterium]|nr:phosphoribosylanthranilate isomerase [Acidobacteriota bacterium]